MSRTMSPTQSSGPNLTVWVAIVVPVLAVLASGVTLWLAYSEREPELPAQYAWEGKALEADLARGARARELAIGVDLDWSTPDLLRAHLVIAPDESVPTQLRLRLTHSTLPALDRDITLVREAGAQYEFVARVEPLPRGRWLVQLEPSAGGVWRLRGKFEAPRRNVRLGQSIGQDPGRS